MESIVLRNIPIRSRESDRGSYAPSELPNHIDDSLLAAILRAGRPEGRAGLITVRGVGCPTISSSSLVGSIVDGVAARIGGKAPRTILCVHGLGHDAWDWTPFFVRCNKSASLVALDLPGFGFADKPEAPPTTSAGAFGGASTGAVWGMDLYVEALLATAAEAPSPPAVVASSLGGHIAILAALHKPEAFSHLVLAAPGGLIGAPSALEAMLRRYYGVEAICARSEDEIVSNSHRIFAKPGCAFDDALAARKLAVHRSDRQREFAVPFSGVVSDVFRHVIADRMHEIRVPMLFLSGARDVVVPPDACAAAARKTGSRFISFNDIGHCPHLEAPDAFADAVMTFIEGTH